MKHKQKGGNTFKCIVKKVCEHYLLKKIWLRIRWIAKYSSEESSEDWANEQIGK